MPLLGLVKVLMIFYALSKIRQKGSAIEWFNNNHIIASLFQLPVIFLSKIDNSVLHKLNMYDNNTETNKSVKLR